MRAPEDDDGGRERDTDVSVQDVAPATRLELMDLATARRWGVTARAVIGSARTEIDALNVFPVPDGDTGTNLYLTLDSALDVLRQDRAAVDAGGLSMSEGTAVLARAALLSARGNSGVIFSQLVRGLHEVVVETGGDVPGIDAPLLAGALRRANDLAWQGVTRPVEGTILSVSAAAAQGAEEALAAGADLYGVAVGALEAARAALERTPQQLPALARAGVVDAGGAGLVLVLEALVRVLSDRPGVLADEDAQVRQARGRRSSWHPASPGAEPAQATDPRSCAGSGTGDRGYEVMYLLADTEEDRVRTLRDQLDRIGDSLLVVGGPQVWNVHVHVDDVGAAIEAGIGAGRPHRVRVTALGQPAEPSTDPGGAHLAAVPGVGVVACAAGEGLADLFRAAGAGVVASGPGQRASTGQLLTAVRAVNAQVVLLLPNDDDTELAAEAAAVAAREEGLDVRVVGSRAAVQGISALAVFDPHADAEQNLLAMTSAAATTRQGGLSIASRDAHTEAGRCRAGDVLGLVEGQIVVIGQDLALVGGEVVERLLGAGGELLTIVTGEQAPRGLAGAVATMTRRRHRDVEVSVVEGGHPAYPLLFGVE